MLKSEEEERKRKRQPPEPDRGHASRSRLWGWSVFSLPRASTVTHVKQVHQAHMKQAQNCSLYLDLRCLGFWSSTAQCLNLKNTREETKWATSTFSFTLPHDQYAIRNIMTVCYLERQQCWQKADVFDVPRRTQVYGLTGNYFLLKPQRFSYFWFVSSEYCSAQITGLN